MLHAANAQLGTTYKIKSMILDHHMLHRLNALGFSEGSLIKVRQKSLFKGPCTLDMNGQHICIRNCDACKIMLELNHD
ncbi:FeoA family protein [Macrococcus equipercicus]|uniref:Ferrous iron transport protein A n=1 Tax=Macrococcus equipercicus TaxID=69967 RepID=A0A9Q9BUW9_9STAP|nr:FeoA family protein [Macrococcus equipercicus]KAA1037691.1 ferrous iron transport protein A [Macrococcus equipercicus]UTH13403.1 ferrous iron transport protein A [Macrococcus equipercicus]